MNSTGFATADFAEWDTQTKFFLLFVMFIGGSAGSTGGGIKVIRWLIVAKALYRELYTTANRRSSVPSGSEERSSTRT